MHLSLLSDHVGHNQTTVMNVAEHQCSQEEECVSPPLAGELSPVTKGRGAAGGPVYKRCHLCVRIFSTKANLSSHIRHVHMGEAKHSRVKSIPCPHCNKMFSRKVIDHHDPFISQTMLMSGSHDRACQNRPWGKEEDIQGSQLPGQFPRKRESSIIKSLTFQHCGKTFRRKWGLNIHISSAHADVINAVVKQ